MGERVRQDFTEFVTARSAELLRLAYVLTADRHAAEDLLQNTLIKAAAHWGRIHSSPEAYVRRIMYREQVSLWRWRARRPETAMAQVPEPAGPPGLDQPGAVVARLDLKDALLVQSPPGTYVLVFRLAGTDIRRFAALTSTLARQPSPRNQLAIILGALVFSHSTVRAPITTGQAVLNGGYTRPTGPEGILHHLGYLPPGSGG